jgi:uncharacterized protein YkwD
MRKGLVVATMLVGLLLTVACSPAENFTWEQVNAFRTANGVGELAWEDGAYAKAVAWSEHMADQRKLSHSRLADDVDTEWRVLGENVAYASDLTQALDALKRSPAHRANLLNPAFNRIAVGVVERDGRFWVTQVFLG